MIFPSLEVSQRHHADKCVDATDDTIINSLKDVFSRCPIILWDWKPGLVRLPSQHYKENKKPFRISLHSFSGKEWHRGVPQSKHYKIYFYRSCALQLAFRWASSSWLRLRRWDSSIHGLLLKILFSFLRWKLSSEANMKHYFFLKSAG